MAAQVVYWCDTHAMRRAAKPQLAFVEGCGLCGVIRSGMLVLRPSGEMLCRPCADRLAAFFQKANGELLTLLWSSPPRASLPDFPSRPLSASGRERDQVIEDAVARLDAASPPEASMDVDAVFAKFKEGVARTLRPDDVEAHYDLASAYMEMGLADDALREASFALREAVAHDRAEAVFNWIFDERHARPDAFPRVVSAMRIS